MNTPPKVGDKVKVTQLTDIDEAHDSPNRIITDPTSSYTMDWQDPPRTLIGQVGIVTHAAMNDYYDCTVQFPWNHENEDLAMKYDDLELVVDTTEGIDNG